MEITYRTLQDAVYARNQALLDNLSNPLVSLIDIGWKMSADPATGKEVYTGEMAVRVHLKFKASEEIVEDWRENRPDLYVDQDKIPFLSDIIQARYALQEYWWGFPEPRAERCATLKGGISVSGKYIFGYGTLGGIVEDRVTGDKMILSNWHVLAGSDEVKEGTPIYQPAYGDGGSDYDTVAVLTRHAFNQDIDAAVARLTGDRDWENDQLDIGKVKGCKAPLPGMRLIKSGRASKVTHGRIDGFLGVKPLRYNDQLHIIQHVFNIVPQPGETCVSSPGDSGSWWLDEDTFEAVGLHFAGQDYPERALAMSMQQVLDALNVNIAGLGQAQPARTEPGRVAVPVIG